MKNKSVTDIVRWLEENLNRSLLTVDHWQADASAIGVALPENPNQLVYISIFGRPDDKYFVELESEPPEGSDLPYAMIGQHKEVDRETLLRIAREHLSPRKHKA